MDSNIKVSVVVPVYNVEKYLNQCLDSLINQTLKDIEIICVNDGSTDSSLKILEEYASKDSRINIVSQENKGLSGARNTGMKYIKGDYTFFIDSDDWIELNALESLYEKAKQKDLDMLFFQIRNFYENTGEFKDEQYGAISVVNSSFDDKVFSYKDVLDVLFKIPHSAFNKLYKTSFLKKLDVEFPEGLNYEDILFFFSVFLEASRVSILRKPLYLYRIRDDSIMSKSKEKSLNIFDILSKSYQIIKEKGILDTNLQDFLLYVIVNFKNVYSTVDSSFRDIYFDTLKNNYYKFGLDKVDKKYENWHYDDKSFHQSIEESDNSKEFYLLWELLNYKFLANHYKELYEQTENKNKEMKIQANKSFKNKFKSILNK